MTYVPASIGRSGARLGPPGRAYPRGMALEQHTGHGQHGGHQAPGGHAGHGDHAAQFRDRFWLSLALTVPVVAYSEMVQEWLGFTPPQFPGTRS